MPTPGADSPATTQPRETLFGTDDVTEKKATNKLQTEVIDSRAKKDTNSEGGDKTDKPAQPEKKTDFHPENGEYDKQGRLVKSKYPNGTSREFEYDGDSNRVTKFTQRDKDNQVTGTYERSGNSQDWNYSKDGQPGGVWKGDIQTDKDGTWKYNEADKSKNPRDLWCHINDQGAPEWKRDNKDGSTVHYDDNKRFSSIERKDGSSVNWEGNTEYAKVHATNPDGKKMNFEWDMQQKVWKCDNPDVKQSADYPVNGSGQLTYETKDGNKVTINTDSSTTVTKPDGSAVETDAKGHVVRTVARNGNERLFERGKTESECHDGVCTIPQDKITGYTEKIKGKPDNHVDLTEDKNVRLDEKGDLYHTSKDGKRQIETADLAHVELNDKGKPVKVTAANGAIREIEWNPNTNEAASITDKIKTPTGEVARKWETTPEWNGTFAVVSEKDGKMTASYPRHDVKIDDHGNYQYTSQNGERATSKPGDGTRSGDSAISGNVSEAHENLMDTMRSRMTPSQLNRFEAMMNRFEKRQQLMTDFQVANGAGDRTDLENKSSKVVSRTYDQLSEMVNSPQGFYDQTTRNKLAEDFMFHAADPTTMNQGRQGTCWIEAASIAGGMVGHTDEMARLVKEVSLTRTYHATNPSLDNSQRKQDFTFSPQLLQINPNDRGGNWTIDSSNQNARSPISFILDQTLPVIGGRPEGRSNGGPFNGPDSSHNVMWMVAGADVKRGADGVGGREMQYLIKDGAFTSENRQHKWGYQLAMVGDKLAVVRDDQYPGNDRVVMGLPDKTPVHIDRYMGASRVGKVAYQPPARDERDVPIYGQPESRNRPQQQQDFPDMPNQQQRFRRAQRQDQEIANQPDQTYQPDQVNQPDQSYQQYEPRRPLRNLLRRVFN